MSEYVQCCVAVLPEGGLQDAAAGHGPGQQEQLLLQGEACTPRDGKRASQLGITSWSSV